jgi:spore coat polysaccharide biosynthesis protein SpsF
VLRAVVGRPLLALQLERVARSRRIDRMIVATSDREDDAPIAAVAEAEGFECFRGSLEDVLDRVYQAARRSSPDLVVRLTGDCPLADSDLIDQIIVFCRSGGFDYASNALTPTFPDGLDVEVVRFACLEEAWREAKLPFEREHVLPFIYTRPGRFRLGAFTGKIDRSHLRWTVDEPEDLELVTRIFEALYPQNPAFSTADILSLLDREPALAQLNAHHVRNAGSLSPAGNPS